MKIQSDTEERWNWLTHGFAFILSILGLYVLVTHDTEQSKYSLFSLLLYGISLLVLYFASSAYHFSQNPILKRRFRVLDHISIYVLIAGTYSPVALISLLNSRGWLLFFLVWTIALIGTILKLFFTGRFEIMSVILYLIMGWLIVFDIEALITQVGSDGITYLIIGGLLYTVGIIFYAIKKIPFNHVIWHVFVMGGSIFHFLFIFKYVI
ncbi:PAQR family membrane homeostasis protein TrhA [Aquimarina pacifica]|uniref:PAQR family membrane homeostasis protein TrhA n=1 Tax=Aquimarina pacifica TaxID=1296415 RepID=UPI000472C7E2|nr:hemolysin III family protein [Aquimarina pacifica]